MRTASLSVVALVLSSAFGSSASAGINFQGGSFLQFSNAFGGGGTQTVSNTSTRGGQSEVQFGVGLGAGTDPNVLRFTGVANFNAPAETDFVIGTVSYFNGLTETGAQGANGALTTIFDVPALPNQVFNFLFNFTITENTSGNPVTDADLLNFGTPANPNVIVIGNTQYTLAINGFRLPSGGTLTTLSLPEGQTVTADVIARFTTEIIPAPSSAALLGLGGLLAARRRR
ncbi:MAG: choice-of-anchor K domain-containing protein [Phycisphaerales bacterium]|nr:choice-of-anchor K domain-containing protein [Phycisphaerales bacterium]